MPGSLELEPDDAALIVVDMQNSFLEDGGSMDRMGFDVDRMKEALPGCVELVETAREAGIPVIFTRYVLEEDFSDGGVLLDLMPEMAEAEALVEGSWDMEIVPELAPEPDDIVIDKNRPSSFIGTELDDIVAEQGIEQLVVCGVTTNCCVESTVRDASQYDIEPFMVEDATAEWDDERYEVALRSMDMLFAEVVSTEHVVETVQEELAVEP